MGSGKWDSDKYTHDAVVRKSTGTADFAYTGTAAARTTVHSTLDPKRINGKPFGKLESRDSVEHPESVAVAVCFDVTGSNISRAIEAQKQLPKLMDLLVGKDGHAGYVTDPQVLVGANDDFEVEPTRCVQISEFESDNRIDESIRNIILVGNGGGNLKESYDLLLYAFARKTAIDCFEKRGKRGYLFLYADEPFTHQVDKKQIKAVFDDDIERNIPIADMIAEAQKYYQIYLLSTVSPLHGAAEQYLQLFGPEHVITLQHPDHICQVIGPIVGLCEGKTTTDTAVEDLVAVGASAKEAKDIVTTTLAPLATMTAATAKTKKGTGAARL